MSGVELSTEEIEELYALLKWREADLTRRLSGLLCRLEKSLYGRLTVGELEELAKRFASGV
jgi:hypothetical protein